MAKVGVVVIECCDGPGEARQIDLELPSPSATRLGRPHGGASVSSVSMGGDEGDNSEPGGVPPPLWTRPQPSGDPAGARLAVNYWERVVAHQLQVACKDDWRRTVLIRPTLGNDAGADRGCAGSPGLFAYHRPHCAPEEAATTMRPNVAATRLAMACGLLSHRFYGRVLVAREHLASSLPTVSVSTDELFPATCVSPDLRQSTLEELVPPPERHRSPPAVRDWLANAAQSNYHDVEALVRLSHVMLQDGPAEADKDGESDDVEGSASDASSVSQSDSSSSTPHRHSRGERAPAFVPVRVPLCLHCRKPASELCPDCSGAYFCNASCRGNGWSHRCWCATWRLYENHRVELSAFSFLGDWHKELVERACQLSDKPYSDFVSRITAMGQLVETTKGEALSSYEDIGSNRSRGAKAQSFETQGTWWSAEWGGRSCNAGHDGSIAIAQRYSYLQGFCPVVDVPPESHVTAEDVSRLECVERNAVGLLRLRNWDDYYRLRNIPATSPVALLLTFPVTLYHALVEFGHAPCAVAQMMRRRLRVHVVGAEKEVRFLDLFREVAFLLGEEYALELVFVVRRDALPLSLERRLGGGGQASVSMEVSEHVSAILVSGTYGESLHPDFDCGSGSPDVVVAFNAGLYAYPTWRSVVSYLHRRPSVVGVFTDYNEMSAVQCASLGGAKARESVRVNPFRQPRAMPVYSMNLPQFGNGFMYAYNTQDLD